MTCVSGADIAVVGGVLPLMRVTSPSLPPCGPPLMGTVKEGIL